MAIPHYPVQAACPLLVAEFSLPTLIANAGACVVAHITNVDVVGVLVFGLRFMFGSPSRLGWHPHFDGDFVVSADMGYVRGSLQRVGVEDGGRLGNHCWCYW